MLQVYDGDTAQYDRPRIRDSAHLLITNPDMLHMSILPMHQNFARLLAKLKYVIVDEGHAYKGVFGCHTALVLRRLRRVCLRVYNCVPRFVVTSATIANPGQHAAILLGVEHVVCIDEDGSPHGPKDFVLWNPPLTFTEQQQQQKQGGQADDDNTQQQDGEEEDVLAKLKYMTRTEARKVAKVTKRAEQERRRFLLRESNAAARWGQACIQTHVVVIAGLYMCVLCCNIYTICTGEVMDV